MDRRSFIAKSSLAMIAAAGLPKGILADKPNSLVTYKTKLQTGVPRQLYYELTMDDVGMLYYKTASDEQKIITLKVAYFETTDLATPTSGAEFRYKIKESIKTDEVNGIWKIKTKFDKKVTGDYKLPKEFPKHMTLVGKSYSYFNIIDKKEQSLINIPYPSTTSSGTGTGGCFLTTACVEHKQMMDDCDELTTLRFLRDNYMKKNDATISLINNYQISGPQIVNAIERCTNKNEIYDYMYLNMITPSVQLVKEGKFIEAVDYYRIFVKALADKYL